MMKGASALNPLYKCEYGQVTLVLMLEPAPNIGVPKAETAIRPSYALAY